MSITDSVLSIALRLICLFAEWMLLSSLCIAYLWKSWKKSAVNLTKSWPILSSAKDMRDFCIIVWLLWDRTLIILAVRTANLCYFGLGRAVNLWLLTFSWLRADSRCSWMALHYSELLQVPVRMGPGWFTIKELGRPFDTASLSRRLRGAQRESSGSP